MSDEIPVGSPPAPPGRHAAPGGWYADPVDPARERYWDGWQWTRNVREGGRGQGRYAGAPPRQPSTTGSHGQAPGAAGLYGQAPGDQEPSSGPYAPGPYAPGPYEPPGPGGGWPRQPAGSPGGPAYRLLPATADGVPLAGWWWRVAAFLVDYFILNAVTQLISALTPLGAGITRSTNAYQAYLIEVLTTGEELDLGYAVSLLNTPELVILNVISIVLFVVYSALMLSSRGATLGKLLFRLRVVPVDNGQSGPGLPAKTAWVRPVANQVLALLAPVALVNYLFPLWDRRKQTLHDKVARTQVVREARR